MEFFAPNLTNWEELLAIGGIAALLAAIVARGRDLLTIYAWTKTALERYKAKRVHARVFVLEELRWREYEIRGEARWLTARLPDGTLGVIKVTSQLCRYIGLGEQQVLDEGWKSTVHQNYAEIIRRWDHAMENGTNFQGKWAFEHAGGKLVYVHAEFHRITDRRGRFLGGLGRMTKITRQDVEDATDA